MAYVLVTEAGMHTRKDMTTMGMGTTTEGLFSSKEIVTMTVCMMWASETAEGLFSCKELLFMQIQLVTMTMFMMRMVALASFNMLDLVDDGGFSNRFSLDLLWMRTGMSKGLSNKNENDGNPRMHDSKLGYGRLLVSIYIPKCVLYKSVKLHELFCS